MKHLLYETTDCVGVLTINRPEALNALNSALVAELSAFLDEAAETDIRCLIVTGSGEKSFVAGADVGEMAEFDSAEAKEFCRRGNEALRKLETLPVPVIAAVNGFAFGGGLELALACDIRLASSSASFALPETTLGVIPGYGGIQRLARAVGHAMARELVFSARRLKADEALATRLVNAVHAPAELLSAARELAGRIAACAPLAVRAAKRVFNAPADAPFPAESEEFAACFGTRDQREAMRAFREKRKPAPFAGE